MKRRQRYKTARMVTKLILQKFGYEIVSKSDDTDFASVSCYTFQGKPELMIEHYRRYGYEYSMECIPFTPQTTERAFEKAVDKLWKLFPQGFTVLDTVNSI